MVCEHLSEVERALIEAGAEVAYRGQPWSNNCREWVYFDALLDLPRIRQVYALADVVQDHLHLGTHDGQEQGLVCSACHDAVMGVVDRGPRTLRFPA